MANANPTGPGRKVPSPKPATSKPGVEYVRGEKGQPIERTTLPSGNIKDRVIFEGDFPQKLTNG